MTHDRGVQDFIAGVWLSDYSTIATRCCIFSGRVVCVVGGTFRSLYRTLRRTFRMISTLYRSVYGAKYDEIRVIALKVRQPTHFDGFLDLKKQTFTWDTRRTHYVIFGQSASFCPFLKLFHSTLLCLLWPHVRFRINLSTGAWKKIMEVHCYFSTLKMDLEFQKKWMSESVIFAHFLSIKVGTKMC